MQNDSIQRLSGVVFDLDGTLLDTMAQWNSLGIDYLRSQGVEPGDDLIDVLGSMSLRESADYLRERYGLDLSAGQIRETMTARLRILYERDVRPKVGALETLRFLKERGVKIALATATASELAIAGLRRVGALAYFDAIVSCRDPEIRAGKEYPNVFFAARERLGTPLAETVVVEDALYAVQTAKNAGFFVVAIEDVGERSRREAVRATADVYVDDHFALQRTFATWPTVD